jgi:dihydropteroate synthase
MSMSLPEILGSHRTGQKAVMGILNVTPDSFSDGGRYDRPQSALPHVEQMLLDKADIVDVGAESTRPGAPRMSCDQQKQRLETILPAAVEAGALVSIDTTRSDVAAWALEAGAAMLNDISAGRDDPEMLSLAAEKNVPIILMHMQGTPETMQDHPCYGDVVDEVRSFLASRLEAAQRAGVPQGHCIVDPGIGFGKTCLHNLLLLQQLEKLRALEVPILVGPSRKRFIAETAGQVPPTLRLGGTVAACLAAARGGATIFRVHDVLPVRQALAVDEAVSGAGTGPR